MNIDELKARIPIDRVVAHLGGQVMGRGLVYSGWVPVKCPFHEDLSASASLNRAAGLYKCHGCGAPRPREDKAGSIIDLAMLYTGHDVKGAMAWLTETFLR